MIINHINTDANEGCTWDWKCQETIYTALSASYSPGQATYIQNNCIAALTALTGTGSAMIIAVWLYSQLLLELIKIPQHAKLLFGQCSHISTSVGAQDCTLIIIGCYIQSVHTMVCTIHSLTCWKITEKYGLLQNWKLERGGGNQSRRGRIRGDQGNSQSPILIHVTAN